MATRLGTAALIALAAVLAGAPACKRPRALHPAPPNAEDPLPDEIAGFTAAPIVHEPPAQRRTYARGDARVTVTVAHFPMDADQYREWVRASTAGFPQARLDVPDGGGNGFYQCDDHTPPTCSLLVQLRTGTHLELRGGPAGRDDLDAVARGLPLRALAGAP